jgi:hypothetical protein
MPKKKPLHDRKHTAALFREALKGEPGSTRLTFWPLIKEVRKPDYLLYEAEGCPTPLVRPIDAHLDVLLHPKDQRFVGIRLRNYAALKKGKLVGRISEKKRAGLLLYLSEPCSYPRALHVNHHFALLFRHTEPTIIGIQLLGYSRLKRNAEKFEAFLKKLPPRPKTRRRR